MSEQLYSLNPNEQIIARIKRHPVGALPLLLSGVFVAIGLMMASLGISYLGNSMNIQIPAGLVMAAAVLVSGLILVIGYVAIWVYFHNELVITTESVIQINQLSLFGRTVSQLGLEVIQDVTIEQKGVLAHLFNFGTVVLETPGEKANFDFKLAPHPHHISQTILEAQQKYMLSHSDMPKPQI